MLLKPGGGSAFKEKLVIARTRSPARPTRALAGTPRKIRAPKISFAIGLVVVRSVLKREVWFPVTFTLLPEQSRNRRNTFRLNVMDRAALILLWTMALSGAQRIPLGVERSINLGYGFHRDIIAEPAPPNTHVFESVGHFDYLFYGKQKLAALNGCECLLAHAIVYQEGPTGNTFLTSRCWVAELVSR